MNMSKDQLAARRLRAKTHSLTLYIDDPSIKTKLKAAAAREGRSQANWFQHHVMPSVMKRIEECMELPETAPVELKPSRHVTMFERMQNEAAAAFQSK